MQHLVLALALALTAWMILKARGKPWKFLAAVIFGAVSYLILSAQAEYKRPMVVDVKGELIPIGRIDREALSKRVQEILFREPSERGVLRTLDYDRDLTLNVTAIENQYVINGVRKPTLRLARGNIYHFRIPNGVYGEFPFYFSEENRYGGGYYDSEYVAGMFRNQGIDDIVMSLAVTAATPDTIYYHAGTQVDMGGKIEVIDQKMAF